MIWLCSITLADKSAKDKPPSVVGVSRLTLLDCLTTWVYLDNTRTRMRVLFFIWSFVLLYSQKIGGDFTARSFHSRDLACLDYPNISAPIGRNICLADAFLCLLLPNDIRVLFHEKALFLRFLSLLPLLYLAFFRRETGGRRPSEQRHNSSPPKSAFC